MRCLSLGAGGVVYAGGAKDSMYVWRRGAEEGAEGQMLACGQVVRGGGTSYHSRWPFMAPFIALVLASELFMAPVLASAPAPLPNPSQQGIVPLSGRLNRQ